MVVGFWMRFLSDFIDSLFLALFGAVLCLPFSKLFYSMGQNGLWIGLVISFLYTGLLQSSLGEGQSFAKKILKIQVLSLDGEYLSLPKSFLRYFVIALIFYNGSFGQVLNWFFPNSPAVGIFYLAFIGILFCGCVLMVPVHPLKRGLHDLIAGSIVVKKGTYTKELRKVEKKNPQKVQLANVLWLVGSMVALGIGGLVYKATMTNSGGIYHEMLNLSKIVANQTDLQSVGVNLSTTTSSTWTSRALIVSGFLDKEKIEDKAFCDAEDQKILQAVKTNYPKLDKVDKIRITKRTGYSIGIWSFNMSNSEDFTTEGKKIEK